MHAPPSRWVSGACSSDITAGTGQRVSACLGGGDDDDDAAFSAPPAAEPPEFIRSESTSITETSEGAPPLLIASESTAESLPASLLSSISSFFGDRVAALDR